MVEGFHVISSEVSGRLKVDVMSLFMCFACL
jgi:hypothetical protein